MLSKTVMSLVAGAITGFSVYSLVGVSTVNQPPASNMPDVKKWVYDWDKSHGSDSNPIADWVSQYSTLNGDVPCFKLVIFIRHGQYETKKKHAHEKVLTEKGWHQAFQTGCRLREMGIRIDRIIHSNLIRAKQTTAAILAGLNDDIEPLFDSTALTDLVRPPTPEIQSHLITVTAESQTCQIHSPYIPYEGASFDCQESEFLAEGPPPVAPEPLNKTRLSTEERQNLGQRIETGFQLHLHRAPITRQGQLACQGRTACLSQCCNFSTQGPPASFCQCACHRLVRAQPLETIVFVGHANVFRYWLCRLLQFPPEGWLRLSLYHGSMSFGVISHSPGTNETDALGYSDVGIVRMGEVGHLPPDLLTR